MSVTWHGVRLDPLLTPRQVAEVFGVSPKTVVRWARAGKLPFITATTRPARQADGLSSTWKQRR